MAKKWFSIKAKAGQPDVADITVFDEIGGWGITGTDFVNEFKALSAPNINLYVNTPGGNVMDALLMYNTMVQSGKNITAYVMGIAASAGSYIIMAANKIVMPENTFQFLHNPLSGAWGNSAELRDVADMLDKVGASLMATYTKRSGQSMEALTPLFEAESYLTAAECLELGLCDEISPAVMMAAHFDTDRKGIPDNVRAILDASAIAARAAQAAQDAADAAAALEAGKPTAQAVKDAAVAAGLGEYVSVWALTDFADMKAVQAAIAEAVEVNSVCAVVGLAGDAAGYIQARRPLSEVRADLAEKKAAEADAAHTSSVQSSVLVTGNPGAAPKSLWARIRENEKANLRR